MIQIENAPADMPKHWQEYFDRTFRRIAIEIAKDLVINEADRVPLKSANGTLVIFKAAIPGTPITGRGLWLFEGGSWSKIS